MTNTTPDGYNSDGTFVQSNTGSVYPNYNGNSIYAGNLTITSPSATAITFGAGNGTATLSGSGAQSISATSGTAAPVFTRLVVNNAKGLTVNPPTTAPTHPTPHPHSLTTTPTTILHTT